MVGEISDTAMNIFKEKIRPMLTEADKGKYIVINTATGDWVMGIEMEDTEAQARNRFGIGPHKFLLRAGYKAVDSFRPGTKLELEEW
jgi:hypothetical protein